MPSTNSRLGSFACAAALAILLLGVAAAEAKGCKEFAYSISPMQQATQADVVVVGKVVDLENELVQVEQYPGSGAVGYMVANVRIQESLLGVKGLTNLRVAYVPSIRPQISDDAEFGARLNGVRFWRGGMNLNVSQEACFLLQKHPTADFYTLMEYSYPLNKSDLSYEAELKAVRNILKAIEKPIEALQVKDAAERQLAACALVQRYRTQRYGIPAVGNEAIDATESKLILKALTEMKWGELPFDQNGAFSLQTAFYQLGLTPQNGWNQPQQKEGEDFNLTMTNAVSEWFKSNADKYAIQRFVTKQPLTK